MKMSVVFAVFLLSGVNYGKPEHDSTCSFPDYAQNNPDDVMDYWDFGLLDSRVTMTFHDDQWIAQTLGGTSAINTTCIYQLANSTEEGWSDIFITDNTFEDGALCLQFINRTSNILQIKTANVTGVMQCNSDFALVDVPLVANKRRTSQYQKCPLEGAYNLFNMSTNSSKGVEPLCEDYPIHGLLESECTVGEGFYLTFMDRRCIPSYTGWELEQHLYCLDSWQTETRTHFTILGTHYDEPQFCMRIQNSEFVIFQDMTCPEDLPTDTVTFITMDHVKKQKSFDDCKDEDDMMDCSSIEHCQKMPYRSSCKRSCGTCFDIEASCEYDPNIVPQEGGQWVMERDVALHSFVTNAFEFHPNNFSVTNFTQFNCHKKILDHTYVNHLEVTPGCTTRFTCSKFFRVSPAVLQYKFSQFKRDYEDPSEICQDTNFQDDNPPLNNIIRSRDYNILIATEKSLTNQTVDCSFYGNYTFNMSLHYGMHNCTGTLSDLDNCKQQNTVMIDAVCGEQSVKKDFPCIGTIDFGSTSTKVLITQAAEGDEAIGHCWVLKAAEDEGSPLQFYVLNSPQCDRSTLEAIEVGQRHAEANVTAHRVDTCDETPTPKVIATTSESTDVSRATPGFVTDDMTELGQVSSHSSVGITEGMTTEDGTPKDGTTEDTTTQESDSNPTKTPDYGPTAGQVIGILFGVIAGCILVSVLIWLGVREYKKRRSPYRVL